jgi:hypothetical protein
LKRELKAELATKEDIAHLQQTVDGFAKNFKDNDEKVIVVEAKAERLESWVMKAAEKVDIPYKP